MKYFTKTCLLLAVLFTSATALAQYNVTGTVKSESGEPLIGVSIIVKGSTTGTVTDFNGNFSINVRQDPAILEFSYTGFKSQEIEVSSSNSTVNTTLEEDIANLEEVVVTGLATSVKRKNLANAVEQINSRELTGITPQQTMDGALYGKFKGANISANSGAPGGGISIKLRGITSLTANSQPLFIIDGVYVDNSAVKAGFDVVSKSQAGGSQSVQDDPSNRIADIPLDDIETIEVLKGASAAAIYGSRAGAGVVIITTKRGQAGKTRVNLTQSVGINTLLNPLGQRSFDAQKVEDSFGADEVPVFQAAQSKGEIFDYEKELYGNTGVISNTNVSLSGGDEKTQFYGGFSYRDEEGIVRGTGYRKASARLNLDHELFNFFDVKLSSVYINSSADRGYFNNDNSGTTLGISYVSTPPWANLFPDADGNYPNNPYAGGNFLQTADQVTNNESVDRFIVGGIGEARLLTTDNNALRLILRGGTDYYTFGTKAIFPRTLQFQKGGNGTDGAAIVGNTLNTNSNFAAFLVHSYFTDSGISFTSQAGVTAENFNQNTVRSTATFLVGSQTNLDQASSIVAEQNRIIQKDRGFFVQEEVNFQDKLIATLGLRGDKSSNNGDPNKLYYYPKASLALNLHEFSFWNSPTFNQFKLRAAFGQSGNFPVFGAIYNSLDATIVDGSTGSLIATRRGNKTLGPERQTEVEVGFDLGLLNSKLTLDATYYIKNIDDLVLDVNVPTSSGFTRQWSNVGSLGN
ncbi:MAG: SusC/RagA family TonB-linked outer membrane protein, partial [Phaeodactylibacter sp.]|nr:SusC/RagA family TonB-linked outer membrane protein [Phaeodactylibacter sp.]